MKRKLSKWVLPVVVLAVTGLLVTWMGSGKNETSKQKQPRREQTVQVQTLEIQLSALQPELALFGRVESAQELDIVAPATAWIKTVRFTEGARFDQGDSLVELDARDFSIDLEQAKAVLAEAQAAETQQKIDHEYNQKTLESEKALLAVSNQKVARLKTLAAKKLGSDQALDNARQEQLQQRISVSSRQKLVQSHEVTQAQSAAQLQRAQAQLAQAKLNSERSLAQAPYGGIVKQVHVAAGSRATAGSPLVTIYPQNSLRIRAQVPERFSAQIDTALRSGVELNAQIMGAKQQQTIRLNSLSGGASAGGVEALFSLAASEQWRVGELVQIRLKLAEVTNALAVASDAVYRNKRVYTVQDSRLLGSDITVLGERLNAEGETQKIIIGEQLNNNDLLMVTRLANASTGLKVSTVEPSKLVAVPEQKADEKKTGKQLADKVPSGKSSAAQRQAQ